MDQSREKCHVLKAHKDDNVAIVVNPVGLQEGDILESGIRVNSFVPSGHKVALVNLRKGDPILRYGQVIGFAEDTIPQGCHVPEKMVHMPEPPALEDIPLVLAEQPSMEPLTGYSFEGYRNADGTVGTRNILAITTSVQCVAGVAEHVVARIKKELLPRYPNVDDVVAINHSYGCGVAIDAPGAIVPIRTLQNIVLNPNFGGEVMVLGLGCEKLRPERLLPMAGEVGSTGFGGATVINLQDEAFHGFAEMVSGIMALAESKLAALNARQRVSCPLSELVVGMQCGGSDGLSGLTANPAVGFAADLLVRAGGTAIFSEVTEVRDAIHLLVPRAADESVARALIREMQWYDQYLQTGGSDRSANTTPGNKAGGLSNIVEKALGSVVKSGSSPIVDVLAPGERLRKRGLIFAATPASDFLCGTLQLAAGMTVQVFTTGRGTPYGLAAAPVIKLSTNSSLGNRWHDLIDLDAGRIATGQATVPEVGWELFHLIIEIASGRKTTAADRLGLHNDLVLFNPGPVT